MGGFSLQRVIGPLYSTGKRDRFRTRLERTADGKGTEVYISHQGLEEVYTDQDRTTLAWQPRPPDPGLEAEFLRRLMVRLGAKEQSRQAAGGLRAGQAAGRNSQRARTGRRR